MSLDSVFQLVLLKIQIIRTVPNPAGFFLKKRERIALLTRRHLTSEWREGAIEREGQGDGGREGGKERERALWMGRQAAH